MKNVGRQQVSKELKSRGIDSPYLDIFQFCNYFCRLYAV